MIGTGIVTKLSFTGALRATAVACCLLALWGLFSAHSGEVTAAYKQGYRTAQLEQEAALAKKLAQGVQSAREERVLADKSAKSAQEAADVVQATAAGVSTKCTDTGADVLRLLNAPIEAGNAGMRVH
jgi:hypothetical protein